MVALVRTRLTAFARAASSSEAEASAAEDAALFLADALASFDEAPFTVQRLCELLLAPTAYYAKPDKLTRAVEKLLNVTGMVPSPTAPPTAPSHPRIRRRRRPRVAPPRIPRRPADGVRVLACRRRRRSKTAREDDVQNDLFGGLARTRRLVWEIERRRPGAPSPGWNSPGTPGWRRMSSPPRRERRRDSDGDGGGERDGKNREKGERLGTGGH